MSAECVTELDPGGGPDSDSSRCGLQCWRLWGADTTLLYVLKVIRMTGFMKGLYTDVEMKSDNVKVGFREASPPHLNKGCIL